MAKIIKTREATGELFLSLTAVSDDLYHHIVEEIEKQFGEIKKITKEKIVERLSTPEFRDVFLTSKKRSTISLPVTVIDISFPPSYEYGLVSARLLFPLHGEQGKIERLLREIAEEAGLKNVSCAEYGMEVKITLSGKSMPCQISPNLLSLPNGKGQQIFATKKEILSGCSTIR